MRQRLGKKRRRKLGLGLAPTDYSFEVPDQLKTFPDGELFVLEDTGCDDPQGDSFHLVQAITRRLKKERISQLYVNEVEVYEQVRLLLTPFFAPFNQMVSFFHDVVKRLVTRSELQGLVSYVERTWIGQEATLTSREKRPLFKREHSNLYQATIEGRPRHKNHMESDNAKLNKLIKENPSMWDMILGLRSAIRGDYRLLYNEWVAGIVQPRRSADVAKDQKF
uniref:Transposase n=1 Tax=Ditylenchus dipsaci TaxID=166011 RepID=A0A915DKD2_9BILA